MLEDFKRKLEREGKSDNTIKSYILSIKKYLVWYEGSFGTEFRKLYRENVLDFKSYMLNVEGLKSKSTNSILSALIRFNLFLIEEEIQEEVVILKTDKVRIQENFASLSNLSKEDVQQFRQRILENESKMIYSIVSLLIYTGLRISECLSIKMEDFNLTTRELVIKGKGSKERIVLMNDKAVNSLREYIKERNPEEEYLFYSRYNKKLDRTTINKIFKKHSDNITPHSLRHYFCSRAIEVMSVHEVANLAGHSNIHTTLLYTNPSKEEMKNKVNLL